MCKAEFFCMKIFKTKKEREEEKAKLQIDKLKKTCRPVDDVGMDYTRKAAELGDRTYQVKVLQNEIEKLHQELFKLNQEFEKSKIVYADVKPEPPVEAPPNGGIPDEVMETLKALPPVEKEADVQL